MGGSEPGEQELKPHFLSLGSASKPLLLEEEVSMLILSINCNYLMKGAGPTPSLLCSILLSLKAQCTEGRKPSARI